MDAKLRVVGGNKAGLEIPLKKARFVIGRSPECSLRAGSDAISRRHCEIRLTRAKISILDLGSRNGTLVNGKPIDNEHILKSGDEVGVGPLRFQVIVQHGLNTEKRSKVNTIADAAARTAQKVRTDQEDYEDDITKWLTDPPNSESRLMNETLTMRFDETNAVADAPDLSGVPVLADPAEEVLEDADPPPDDETEASISKPHIGKKKGKAKPGKLPAVTGGLAAKDSCEAAAEVLRAMTRRR